MWLGGVKCVGHDTSVRQHYKSEHWAPCYNQTLSWYDWKIVEDDVELEQANNKIRVLDAEPWVPKFPVTNGETLRKTGKRLKHSFGGKKATN